MRFWAFGSIKNIREQKMITNEINETLHRDHQTALCGLLREFDRVCRRLDIPYIIFAGTMLGAVRHQGFVPWDDDIDIMMLRKDYERFLQEAEKILDKEKFFLQKEFSEHWPMFFSKLRRNGTTCLEKFHPKDSEIHQGIYIDIFPCDNAAESGIGRLLQFAASKVVIAKSLDARGYDTDSRKKKAVMALCRILPMKPFLWMVQRGDENSDLVHSFLGGANAFRKNIYPRNYFTERISLLFEDREYPVSAHYDELLRQLYGDYMQIPPPEKRQVKQHAILIDLDHSWEQYAHYRDDMAFDVYTRSIR